MTVGNSLSRDRNKLPDQKRFWNSEHTLKYPNIFVPTELAFTALNLFRQRGVKCILELGCGRSGDATLFAKHGYQVVATDISTVALEVARRNWDTESRTEAGCTLRYVQCSIAEGLPLAAGAFDAVYSRLSIHYFTENVTSDILAWFRNLGS